jgi:hypothetical protein
VLVKDKEIRVSMLVNLNPEFLLEMVLIFAEKNRCKIKLEGLHISTGTDFTKLFIP